MKMRRLLLAISIFAALGAPLHAVTPDEMLSDLKLEARARDLSAHLRCLVCQNQSIDDSDATLAHDLRKLVRERLSAGDSDAQVMAFLVARYGDFILLQPPFRLGTLLLWGTPLLALLLGGAGIALAARRRRAGDMAVTPLSEAEKGDLARVMEQDGG